MNKYIYFAILCLTLMMAACNKNEAKVKVNDPTGKFMKIVDRGLCQADGSEFTIKGVNLNHWLTPEAYCFGFQNISVSEVDKAFRQLFGDEYMNGWWTRFLENYICDEDFVYLNSIAANTVRLPLTYKLFNDTFYLCDNDPEAGFRFIDYVVKMCKEVGLYLILDMHVAPGGQSGASHIDDSDGYPRLFESQANMDEYCRIWRMIAERYAEEPIILGYELLNEPIDAKYDNLYPYLQPTYERVTAAIREVDRNHIIILGGANFCDDFTMLTNYAFDSKIMLTGHRYSSVDVSKFSDISVQTNLPMYMGEFGHWGGGTDLTFQVVSNIKSRGMGYTYWPFKKMNNWESLLGFDVPEEWESIVEFVKSPRETTAQLQIALKKVDIEKATKAME
ncbi:MAG: cellulase family glycosylhydrolase, partial [Bacteroidales bacterium]|nr:cellulase family glycosylhydrolase [Bacteroidales bacterium]